MEMKVQLENKNKSPFKNVKEKSTKTRKLGKTSDPNHLESYDINPNSPY